MECNCNCRKRLKTTKVEVKSGKLNIHIPKVTLGNEEEFDLIIRHRIPKEVTSAEVKIMNGDVEVAVLNRHGNALKGERIFSRKKYTAVYGKKTNHILIRDNLPINRCAIEMD